ncbi:hypothetical protein ABH931_006577 [Streptacidiphilus sp. MAP12-33]|uniref:HAD domain-containing protein n=1 Tax=Streptacidiphilus sp. MAP12-33 TaxID=3156266 RepID=UPI003515F76B
MSRLSAPSALSAFPVRHRSTQLTTLVPPPAKPLLYLDVDGVLNPVCPRPGSGYTRHLLLRSEVLLSAAHGEWLRELAEVYELAWASTWEAWANHCIAPLLGLPALPWVACGGPNSGAPDGDFAPIVRHAAGRPFAWVDDLIPPRLLRRYAERSDVLLLPVEPGQGLRRRHVDRLLSRPPRAAHLSPGPPGWRPPEPAPRPRRPG